VTRRDELTRLYEESPDPWGFESSWYERRKYGLTLAALPRERYRSAYEPGCSIGVLTRLLAARCDALLASDFIPRALDKARARVSDLPHVRIEQRETPAEWPDGPFDLVVLSELAYFLEPDDVVELGRRTGGSTSEGATVIAVHWRGQIDDWPLTVDDAHAMIAAAGGLTRVARLADPGFLLEVFER
jgi:SAM-dependent methyltransferase